MRHLPVHVPISGFDVEDNCLTLGGKKLTEIASKVGTTPFYAYDSTMIRRRIGEIRAALPKQIKLHYAMKANPMPELVGLVATLVDGLDVASAGELHVALETQIASSEISFAGPGKRMEELALAIQSRVVINVESSGELERACRIAGDLDRPAKVAIRVNPDFELKSSGMRMSGGPKPFGIDAEQVPSLLTALDTRNIEFEGFHIFCGSQNLNPDSIVDAQRKCVDLALELSQFSPPPRFINIGGGFGIPYFPGEKQLDLTLIGENLASQLDRVHSRMPNTDLVVELGRFIVGECGLFVTRVVDRKVSRGQVFVVTDGGMNNHLAASGNFGQVLRKNYPVLIGNKVLDEPNEKATIVGPLCTPLDILGDNMELPSVEVGDLVVVMQSGAYGYTASPNRFLSHPEPSEILL